MVSLADIFNNAKIKVQNNELYNKLLGQEYNQVPLVKELPQIKPVQMREDGSMYEIEQPIEKKPTLMQRAVNVGNNAQDAINNIGSKLGNYLLGEQDITTAQGEPIKDENGNLIPSNTISATPRRGGVLRDIAEGYRENRNTPFSIDNLGGRKTFANRFGEAIGTASRFADSPLGRGLIMAGIVGATGGGALPALGFGTVATVKNQQNRMKDELYRNNIISSMQESLKNSPGFEELTPEEQNAQLQKIANSVNAYRGYLGDDTYRQILTGLQLQDNAEYRNALLASNQRNQELAIKQRQDELDYRKYQDSIENQRENRKLDIAESKILSDVKETNKSIENLLAVQQQLKRFENTFANMPKKLESNTLGRLRNATGLQTKEEANFNSQRQLLFNKIARDLGGEKGVLSDQDIKRIEGALPSYTDSTAQKQAKMQAIYDLLNDRLAVEGGSLNETTTNEGWAF